MTTVPDYAVQITADAISRIETGSRAYTREQDLETIMLIALPFLPTADHKISAARFVYRNTGYNDFTGAMACRFLASVDEAPVVPRAELKATLVTLGLASA